MRESNIGNRVLHVVDTCPPQGAGTPVMPAQYTGVTGTAGLQHRWSVHSDVRHAPVQSAQWIGLHTRAAAPPASAASVETRTHDAYPTAGRHLSSVGLGSGASTGTSLTGVADSSSFDVSNGALLGEYISSLDPRDIG